MTARRKPGPTFRRSAPTVGRAVVALAGMALATAVLSAQAPAPAGRQATFERVVQPILLDTCAECHNDREPSAGLSISHLAQPKSLATERDKWELILEKLRAGDAKLHGFFMGQVMKRTEGRASPQLVDRLLRKLIGS